MDLVGTIEDDDSLPEEDTEESDVDEGSIPVRIDYIWYLARCSWVQGLQ